MPLPQPRPDEEREEFLDRCMGDPTMVDEFPDSSQRFAVCVSQWESRGLLGRLQAIGQQLEQIVEGPP